MDKTQKIAYAAMWVVLIGGMLFLWVRPDRAYALTYTEDFEAFSVADLNGQFTWVANNTNMDVQSSSCHAGSRCVGTTASDAKGAWYDLGEDMGAYSTVIVGAYMMGDNTNGGKVQIGLATSTDTSNVSNGQILSSFSKNGYCTAGLNSSSGITLEAATSAVSIQSSFTTNVWYYVELEFNFDTDNCRARVDGGAWSGTKSFYVSQSSYPLEYLLFGVGTTNGFLKRIDDISITTTGGAAEPEEDDSTRFITFTPTLGVSTLNATSTAFEFEATGYINDVDLEEDMYVYARWRNMTEGTLGGAGGCSTFANSTGEFEFELASSTNEFTATSTQSIECYGVYSIVWRLYKPGFSIFGFSIGDSVLLQSAGSFRVGTTTAQPTDVDAYQVDLLFQSGLGTDNYIPDDANASSTILSFASFLNLREQMVGKFPISWAIETIAAFVEATNETATSTLPTVAVDFGMLSTLQWYATTSPDELEVEFWNWDWIETVSDMTAFAALRALLSYILYITVGILAWREAARMFRELTS